MLYMDSDSSVKAYKYNKEILQCGLEFLSINHYLEDLRNYGFKKILRKCFISSLTVVYLIRIKCFGFNKTVINKYNL